MLLFRHAAIAYRFTADALRLPARCCFAMLLPLMLRRFIAASPSVACRRADFSALLHAMLPL